MLQNQDAVPYSQIPDPQIPTNQEIVVSQARVTPGELTRALAAIEARRQAEANRLAETIPIEQAVSELHLDTTPEEIWTEVQAQRDAAVRQTPLLRVQEFVLRRTGHLRGWPALIGPAAALWIVIGAVSPHLGSHNPTVLRPLSQVPSGIEVYANDAALARVASGEPLSHIPVSSSFGHNRWRLVRIGGHIYLRGCIADTDSLGTLQGKTLSVYNDGNSGELFGERISNITLRVDSIPLQKSGGDSDYSEVTLPSFQPDSFTTLDQ